MDLFARIRRDARVEGLGTRKLAARYSVGRNTVRRALQSAEPPTRKTPDRVAPKLGPFKALIDGMLREDLSAPRKQRHTATRIWNRCRFFLELSISQMKCPRDVHLDISSERAPRWRR